MASLSLTVDPFAVAEPNELPDWRLPLSFMKSRHLEKIEASQEPEEWRMRDRVRGEGEGGGEWGRGGRVWKEGGMAEKMIEEESLELSRLLCPASTLQAIPLCQICQLCLSVLSWRLSHRAMQ